jgi:hypothetical protein
MAFRDPKDSDLCLVDDVATALGMATPITDAQRDELQRLVSAATQAMIEEAQLPRRYDGKPQTFFDDKYDERFNGSGTGILPLRHRPLIKIITLTVDGRPIAPTVSDTDFGYCAERGVGVILLRGFCFQRGIQNVRLVSKAGFDEDHPMRDALAQAAIETVSVMYQSKKYLHIQSEKLGDQMITYAKQAFSPRAKTLLGQMQSKMPVAVF